MNAIQKYATSIAADIVQGRRVHIETVEDVQWYVCSHAEYELMSDALVDEVIAQIVKALNL